MRYTIITSALTALIASVSASIAHADTTTTPLWTGQLQQKVCSKLEWKQVAGVNVLRVWNTDTTVLQFPADLSGALTPVQALMSAACSPNLKVPNGHTYWVKVNDPLLVAPIAKRIVVTYPPVAADKKPVFNEPKVAWYYGMQDKTCTAIEWYAIQDSVLLLHNQDDSALSLAGANHAVSPLQQEAIEACGPNSADTNATHKYRVSVVNPNLAISTPSRVLFNVLANDAPAN